MEPSWILHEAEVRSLYTTFDRAGKDPVQMSIGGMIRAAATVVHPASIKKYNTIYIYKFNQNHNNKIQSYSDFLRNCCDLFFADSEVDLLSIPPFSKKVKGWTIRQVPAPGKETTAV